MKYMLAILRPNIEARDEERRVWMEEQKPMEREMADRMNGVMASFNKRRPEPSAAMSLLADACRCRVRVPVLR